MVKTATGGPTSTPQKVTSTLRTPRTPASGRGPAKSGVFRKKKTSDADTSSDDEILASPSVRQKRARTSKARRSYEESDATTGDEEDEFALPSKKVKTEPVEDEGILGVTNTDDPVEDDEAVAYI